MFTTTPVGTRRIRARNNPPLNAPSAPPLSHGTMASRRQQRQHSPAMSENSETSVKSRYSTRSTGKVPDVLFESDNIGNIRRPRKSTPSVDGSEKSSPRRSPRLSSSGGSTPRATNFERPDDVERMTETIEQSYGFDEEEEMYKQLVNSSNLLPDDDASSIDSIHDEHEPLGYRNQAHLNLDYAVDALKSAAFTVVLFLRSQFFMKRILLPASILLLSIWSAPLLYQSLSSLKSGDIDFPAYIVPQGAPQTNEEVIVRLLDLETKLAKLSHASLNFQSEFLHNLKLSDSRVDEFSTNLNAKLSSVEAQVSHIRDSTEKSEGRLKQSYAALSSAFQKFQIRNEDIDAFIEKLNQRVLADEKSGSLHFDNLDQQVSKIFAYLTETNTEIAVVKEQIESLSGKSSSLDAHIDSIGASLVGLESRVNDVVAKIAAIAQEAAIDAIDQILPERLPVRFEDAGSVSIAPEFYAYLKSAFSGGASAGGESAGVSWEEFLARNEASLNRFVDAHVKGYVEHLDDRESFVSKGFFLDLLRREMATVEDNFMSKLHESELVVDKMVSEIAATRTRVNLTQSAIDTLIDEALMRFQDGMMRKKDYADILSGARANPYTTSPSLDPFKKGSGIMSSLFAKPAQPNRPAEALVPEVAQGNCWAFQGQEGVLGIRLSEWIYVDEIALNHLPKELARDTKIAPKEFEFWVEVLNDRKLQELQDAMAGVYSNGRLIEVQDGTDKLKIKVNDKKSSVPDVSLERHVMVGKFTYDINGPFHLQSFRFPRQAARVLKTLPVLTVAFRFTQNWGSEICTCIYKALVYGQPVESLGAYGSESVWDDERGLGDDIPV